ncbi:hypothetical protein [Halalkalicoccus salilacus]|uniref:hypothetical protein n=1 Tax=Halalkalicoccus salilacus TaxID=3117459 RepID=UPI00300E9A36
MGTSRDIASIVVTVAIGFGVMSIYSIGFIDYLVIGSYVWTRPGILIEQTNYNSQWYLVYFP